jgi:hypothetical protein
MIEQDKRLVDAFNDLLPYYNAQVGDVPASLKLMLYLNRWPNAAMACHDIANNMIEDKKTAKELCRKLNHIQAFGEGCAINKDGKEV